ncbi:MAG: hypothetical protein LBP28_05765 [Coriobacteriales bacterium]|jgi:hypothetical protein|nr:hypothetical protein [Coriobacteriales bacterium]
MGFFKRRSLKSAVKSAARKTIKKALSPAKKKKKAAPAMTNSRRGLENPTPTAKAFETPLGKIRVRVEGERYRKEKINKMKKNVPRRFSLTPQNQYQRDVGWPEGNFVNLNTYPSKRTTYNNWLGYVEYDGKPSASILAQYVNSGHPVSVWGEVVQNGEYVDIYLLLPRKNEIVLP